MNTTKSKALFEQAQQHIPGGVNSPVRAFRQVGGTPIFMARAAGAYMYDADGNPYIDYINSWGPMILGHGHPDVQAAVAEQVKTAFSFGAPTATEIEIAQQIKKMVPNIDLVRMVNSGTEACMSALRLARGFTGRSKVIKFEGHYHGHADPFLKKAGSGVATLGIRQEGGIPTVVSDDTLVLAFNDKQALADCIAQNKSDLAAIIVEPVAGNMGCVTPQPGYLELMREICTQHGIVLIFDEVMTGFRLATGGAQQRLGVWADLVTFGKVIGGGLPVGAFGGRRDIMSLVAPLGNVYQAGTLSGNPLAMSAGLATLKVLDETPQLYTDLDAKGAQLQTKLTEVFSAKQLPYTINQLGSMISIHFCENKVVDFQTAAVGNNDTFKRFFHHLLDKGIYLPPSPFETWFLSAALSQADIDETIKACISFE